MLRPWWSWKRCWWLNAFPKRLLNALWIPCIASRNASWLSDNGRLPFEGTTGFVAGVTAKDSASDPFFMTLLTLTYSPNRRQHLTTTREFFKLFCVTAWIIPCRSMTTKTPLDEYRGGIRPNRGHWWRSEAGIPRRVPLFYVRWQHHRLKGVPLASKWLLLDHPLKLRLSLKCTRLNLNQLDSKEW